MDEEDKERSIFWEMQKKSEKEEDEVWKMKRMRRRRDRFSLRSIPGSVHSKRKTERQKERETN